MADDLELLEDLRAYTALDNPVRLSAFRLIHERPGRSFNDIAKELDVDSGLAAYHIAVLKAAGLVEVTYHRSGRATSAYRLTERGEQLRSNLFSSRRSRHSRPSRPRSASVGRTGSTQPRSARLT